MPIIIERAVPSQALEGVLRAIDGERFVASTDDAGSVDAPVACERVPPSSLGARTAAASLLACLRSHPAFDAATYAGAMTLPIFYRYTVGPTRPMQVDPPVLGAFPKLRADLAITVCLDDRASYEGGTITVDDAGLITTWNGAAGDCIVCPAGAPRRIAGLVRGTARFAIFWVQSLIADSRQRQILFDLGQALDQLQTTSIAPRHIDALRKSCINLTRLWAADPTHAA